MQDIFNISEDPLKAGGYTVQVAYVCLDDEDSTLEAVEVMFRDVSKFLVRKLRQMRLPKHVKNTLGQRYGIAWSHTHTHIVKVWTNRVRLPILLVVSRTGKNNVSLSTFAPENLASRDGFGSPVPRQPAHLHTEAESGAYLRNSSRVSRQRLFICSTRPTPSGQSRVYRVTQLRTDGVHRQESADPGPVNLEVVPNECCLGRSPWTN